jgi:hypothetical protein
MKQRFTYHFLLTDEAASAVGSPRIVITNYFRFFRLASIGAFFPVEQKNLRFEKSRTTFVLARLFDPRAHFRIDRVGVRLLNTGIRI